MSLFTANCRRNVYLAVSSGICARKATLPRERILAYRLITVLGLGIQNNIRSLSRHRAYVLLSDEPKPVDILVGFGCSNSIEFCCGLGFVIQLALADLAVGRVPLHSYTIIGLNTYRWPASTMAMASIPKFKARKCELLRERKVSILVHFGR